VDGTFEESFYAAYLCNVFWFIDISIIVIAAQCVFNGDIANCLIYFQQRDGVILRLIIDIIISRYRNKHFLYFSQYRSGYLLDADFAILHLIFAFLL